MAKFPLLALPRPTKRGARSAGRVQETVPGISHGRQSVRLGPKFERLAETLPDPKALADLRDDPTAIVPERALVFEVAGTLTDFYRAMRSINLEFLGEEEADFDADADFGVTNKPGERVPVRLYFTIPDERALRELVSLWRLFQQGKQLGYGRAAWRQVFSHLKDIRPWGAQDRLTVEVLEDWKGRIETASDQPVHFEVEFWFRDQEMRRQGVEQSFREAIDRMGGQVIDSTQISPIRYHAVLAEVPATVIGEVLAHPNIGLAAFDDIMVLRPQSVVGEPLEGDVEQTEDRVPEEVGASLLAPIAALFDGLPMAQHQLLADRLIIDDPDDFASEYGHASEQQHGTAMASLILHGDLNEPHLPVQHKLYVRPVMYPQAWGNGPRQEFMPPIRLGIDLIWRAFIQMFEGEDGSPASAPSVRIVNLSLGDAKRRFAGIMSPWARLVDYIAWNYKTLILISAGNILDPLPLLGVATWQEFEDASPADRQSIVLRSVLQQRAVRRLLSPSEAINALTIGACHADQMANNGHGVMVADPYESEFLPNTTSALGLGFRRGIKPELLFPGGREKLRSNTNHAPIDLRPIGSPNRLFGIKAASPGTRGTLSEVTCHHGTSVATAMATHSAIRIVEALEAAEPDPAHVSVDDSFYSLVLKALLVHAARWHSSTVASLKEIVNPNGSLYWEHEREELTRFFGYGRPDIERVLDCAEERATLVGWGALQDGDANQYRVPLPPELENLSGFRAVSITVAWLTPLNLNHRMYRMAKLSAFPGNDKEFSLGVSTLGVQPSHHAVERGTVFHKSWEGTDAVPFVDNGDLIFNIECKATAGDIDTDIPYAVALTIEVGQDVKIPVYERVRERLRAAVRVAP